MRLKIIGMAILICGAMAISVPQSGADATPTKAAMDASLRCGLVALEHSDVTEGNIKACHTWLRSAKRQCRTADTAIVYFTPKYRYELQLGHKPTLIKGDGNLGRLANSCRVSGPGMVILTAKAPPTKAASTTTTSQPQPPPTTTTTVATVVVPNAIEIANTEGWALAEEQVQMAGLTYVFSYVPTVNCDLGGEALSQFPLAGSTVPVGTVVTIQRLQC
jgi:hypothetical protein